MGIKTELMLVEHYRLGHLTGTRELWQRNVLMLQETYDRRGRLDGPWVSWRDKQHKRAEGTYVKGKRDGLWTWYGDDGSKTRQGSLRRRQARGPVARVATATDVTWAASYAGGVLNGDVVEYDWRGRERNRYHFDQGTGVQTELWPNRRLSLQVHRVGGRRQGGYLERYRDGKKAVQGYYYAGHKVGTWRAWARNGQLVEQARYRHGRLDGPWKRWDDDGSLVAEAAYRRGQAQWRLRRVLRRRQPRRGRGVTSPTAATASGRSGTATARSPRARPGRPASSTGRGRSSTRAACSRCRASSTPGGATGTWRYLGADGQLQRTVTYP